MDEQPSYREIIRAQRRAVLVKIGLVGLGLLFVLVASVHRPLLVHLGGWVHGDHDLLGRSRWAPPALPVEPGAVDGLDLEHIHAELLTDWFIAVANDAPESSRVRRALDALRTGVAADPQLAALVEQMHAFASTDPVAHSEQLYTLTDAWNAHMDALGQPWQVESNVTAGGDGPFFYTKSYRIEAARSVMIAGAPVPLRVLRRVDRSNLREGYLGMVVEGDERALVLVDRVRDFALDELWQLFDPALDPELSAREAAFAPLARAEAAALLEPAQVEVLRATARARWEMRAVGMAMELRRACGAGLSMRAPPWQGLDKAELDLLEDLSARSGNPACPDITLDEVDRLRAATRLIRQTGDLEPALEALVAWAARATAVHELQHVADTRAHGVLEAPPCGSCGELPAAVGRELSAYTASLAHSGAGSAALLQACQQRGGSHGWAVDELSGRLGGACDVPGVTLGARAQALEAALYGARDAMAIPQDWPQGLPVR